MLAQGGGFYICLGVVPRCWCLFRVLARNTELLASLNIHCTVAVWRLQMQAYDPKVNSLDLSAERICVWEVKLNRSLHLSCQLLLSCWARYFSFQLLWWSCQQHMTEVSSQDVVKTCWKRLFLLISLIEDNEVMYRNQVNTKKRLILNFCHQYLKPAQSAKSE